MEINGITNWGRGVLKGRKEARLRKQDAKTLKEIENAKSENDIYYSLVKGLKLDESRMKLFKQFDEKGIYDRFKSGNYDGGSGNDDKRIERTIENPFFILRRLKEDKNKYEVLLWVNERMKETKIKNDKDSIISDNINDTVLVFEGKVEEAYHYDSGEVLLKECFTTPEYREKVLDMMFESTNIYGEAMKVLEEMGSEKRMEFLSHHNLKSFEAFAIYRKFDDANFIEKYSTQIKEYVGVDEKGDEDTKKLRENVHLNINEKQAKELLTLFGDKMLPQYIIECMGKLSLTELPKYIEMYKDRVAPEDIKRLIIEPFTKLPEDIKSNGYKLNPADVKKLTLEHHAKLLENIERYKDILNPEDIQRLLSASISVMPKGEYREKQIELHKNELGTKVMSDIFLDTYRGGGVDYGNRGRLIFEVLGRNYENPMVQNCSAEQFIVKYADMVDEQALSKFFGKYNRAKEREEQSLKAYRKSEPNFKDKDLGGGILNSNLYPPTYIYRKVTQLHYINSEEYEEKIVPMQILSAEEACYKENPHLLYNIATLYYDKRLEDENFKSEDASNVVRNLPILDRLKFTEKYKDRIPEIAIPKEEVISIIVSAPIEIRDDLIVQMNLTPEQKNEVKIAVLSRQLRDVEENGNISYLDKSGKIIELKRQIEELGKNKPTGQQMIDDVVAEGKEAGITSAEISSANEQINQAQRDAEQPQKTTEENVIGG
ncbi:MAG: hypothetical protein FWF46_01135 [Oscillospiraceae bacterium]|nr:hypothetical protein [Oscillospiraceae bacterium]